MGVATAVTVSVSVVALFFILLFLIVYYPRSSTSFPAAFESSLAPSGTPFPAQSELPLPEFVFSNRIRASIEGTMGDVVRYDTTFQLGVSVENSVDNNSTLFGLSRESGQVQRNFGALDLPLENQVADIRLLAATDVTPPRFLTWTTTDVCSYYLDEDGRWTKHFSVAAAFVRSCAYVHDVSDQEVFVIIATGTQLYWYNVTDVTTNTRPGQSFGREYVEITGGHDRFLAVRPGARAIDEYQLALENVSFTLTTTIEFADLIIMNPVMKQDTGDAFLALELYDESDERVVTLYRRAVENGTPVWARQQALQRSTNGGAIPFTADINFSLAAVRDGAATQTSIYRWNPLSDLFLIGGPDPVVLDVAAKNDAVMSVSASRLQRQGHFLVGQGTQPNEIDVYEWNF